MSDREFENYFNQYYNTALDYAVRHISDYHQAEDLVMDSFLSCYNNKDKYDSQKASFGTWLFAILNNRLKNYYRDKKHHDDLEACLDLSERFEDEFLEAEYIKTMSDALAQALLTLSDTARKIVILRYFDEMKSEEIGQKLGMSAVNVRVSLNRAISVLREYFKQNNIHWEL